VWEEVAATKASGETARRPHGETSRPACGVSAPNCSLVHGNSAQILPF
jgi:hypothetical protein